MCSNATPPGRMRILNIFAQQELLPQAPQNNLFLPNEIPHNEVQERQQQVQGQQAQELQQQVQGQQQAQLEQQVPYFPVQHDQ